MISFISQQCREGKCPLAFPSVRSLGETEGSDPGDSLPITTQTLSLHISMNSPFTLMPAKSSVSLYISGRLFLNLLIIVMLTEETPPILLFRLPQQPFTGQNTLPMNETKLVNIYRWPTVPRRRALWNLFLRRQIFLRWLRRISSTRGYASEHGGKMGAGQFSIEKDSKLSVLATVMTTILQANICAI